MVREGAGDQAPGGVFGDAGSGEGAADRDPSISTGHRGADPAPSEDAPGPGQPSQSVAPEEESGRSAEGETAAPGGQSAELVSGEASEGAAPNSSPPAGPGEEGVPEGPEPAVAPAPASQSLQPGGEGRSLELLERWMGELGYGNVPVGFLTVLQAVLFAADKPLSVAALQRILDSQDTALIRNGLRALVELHRGWGYELVEVAGGYQFRTNPEHAGWVKRLVPPKRSRLSRAALEVLAVVAYQQPVTRAEIEQIRGVDCGAVLRTLLERNLVRIVGRKEEPGRPLLYGTTKEFLEFFGLKSLKDLPSLRDLEASVLPESTRPATEQKSATASFADLLDGIQNRMDQPDEEVEEILSEAMAAAKKARQTFKRIQEREASLRPEPSRDQDGPADQGEAGEAATKDRGAGEETAPKSVEELVRRKLEAAGPSDESGDAS